MKNSLSHGVDNMKPPPVALFDCFCCLWSQLESEVLFVDKWLTGHVSDHSALNHRKNVASALAAVSSGQLQEKKMH